MNKSDIKNAIKEQKKTAKLEMIYTVTDSKQHKSHLKCGILIKFGICYDRERTRVFWHTNTFFASIYKIIASHDNICCFFFFLFYSVVVLPKLFLFVRSRIMLVEIFFMNIQVARVCDKSRFRP